MCCMREKGGESGRVAERERRKSGREAEDREEESCLERGGEGGREREERTNQKMK